MAAGQIARRFEAMGDGVTAQIRQKDGAPLVTDNGQHILDVRGLKIAEPLAFESEVNQWPGVVTVGVLRTRRPRFACWERLKACRRWNTEHSALSRSQRRHVAGFCYVFDSCLRLMGKRYMPF